MTRKTLIFIVTLGIAGALLAAGRDPSGETAAVTTDAAPAAHAIHDTAGAVTLVAW